jgi:membrane-anchored protein YejM (alkaline phosphatase superfamily)
MRTLWNRSGGLVVSRPQSRINQSTLYKKKPNLIGWVFLFKLFLIQRLLYYLCVMEEGKKNILGNFLMSVTIGCATFIAFLILCIVMWATTMIFLSYLKPEN